MCSGNKGEKSHPLLRVPYQFPSGNYPDVWYKGLVSTEDFIEKIDIGNNIFLQHS